MEVDDAATTDAEWEDIGREVLPGTDSDKDDGGFCTAATACVHSEVAGAGLTSATATTTTTTNRRRGSSLFCALYNVRALNLIRNYIYQSGLKINSF